MSNEVYHEVSNLYIPRKTIEVYNLIYDEEQVKRFARLIDTENGIHEVFIMARKKYDESKEGMKNNKSGFMSPKYFYGYDANSYLHIVQNYEKRIGNYLDKEGNPYPDNTLVVYSTTNPRCGKKAANKFMKEIMDNLFAENQESCGIFNSLDKRLHSCIMSSKDKTKFITIDIDNKSEYNEVLEYLKSIDLLPEAVIETHGGYHVLLPVNKSLNLVFEKFSKKHTMGDISCPIPGTFQGGFPVRFV